MHHPCVVRKRKRLVHSLTFGVKREFLFIYFVFSFLYWSRGSDILTDNPVSMRRDGPTLRLHRTVLARVDSISRFGTGAVVPAIVGERDSFVLADDSGNVVRFALSKGAVVNTASTVMSGDKVVRALVVDAGASDGGVFVSRGSRIERVVLKARRSGADASVPTQLSEPLRLMRICKAPRGGEVLVWIVGEQIFAHMGGTAMDNLLERQFYMSPDCVCDMAILTFKSDARTAAVLACKDSALRVLVQQPAEVASAQGAAEDARALLIKSTDGPVTVLVVLPTPRAAAPERSPPRARARVAYGTSRGVIAAMELTLATAAAAAGGEPPHAAPLWCIPNRHGRGSVTALTLVDLRLNGVLRIVAGRHDGSLEVYELPTVGGADAAGAEDVDATTAGEPRCVFRADLGELIRGVYAGRVSRAGVMELIVTTFSGRVLSFAPSASSAPGGSINGCADGSADGNAARIARERAEVKRLRAELDALRARAAKKQRHGGANTKEATDVGAAAAEPFSVVCSFELSAATGLYTLALAAPHAIAMLTLRSPIPLVLLPDAPEALRDACGGDADAPAGAADSAPLGLADLSVSSTALGKGSAAGRSARANSAGAAALATFRAVGGAASRRLTVAMRTVEGQWGDLRVLLSCSGIAHGSAQLVSIPIQPLSIHAALPEGWEEDEAAAAAARGEACKPHLLNVLTVSGSFSVAMAHEWVRSLLPGVAPSPPPLHAPLPDGPLMVAPPAAAAAASAATVEGAAPVAELCFRNTQVGTVLRCRCVCALAGRPTLHSFLAHALAAAH
jgi:hypothetical protein